MHHGTPDGSTASDDTRLDAERMKEDERGSVVALDNDDDFYNRE